MNHNGREDMDVLGLLETDYWHVNQGNQMT